MVLSYGQHQAEAIRDWSEETLAALDELPEASRGPVDASLLQRPPREGPGVTWTDT